MFTTRRQFIASTATTVGAVCLPGVRSAFASDAKNLRIAVIGVKGRGQSHVESLRHNVVAICDVDQKVLEARAAAYRKKLGRNIETATDYRDLLERDDIDAVSIATPNHTHALITVAAAKAGKHVYVEKPVSHNVWEGRQMVAAAEKYNRLIQCGTQSRSSKSLQAAVEFVRSGELGKIRYAIGTCYKPRKSIGRLEGPLSIPSDVDYDLWCGPAEQRDLYRPQLHYDWHWDFNTGNGDMGNQGIHQMDIARWFLGEQTLAPRTISIGGRLGYQDAGDTPNTQIVYHDYKAAPLIFETRGLPRSKAGQHAWGESMDRYRGARVGVIIQCEDGYVLVPSYHDAIAYDHRGQIVKEWHGGGNPHHWNWLQAIAAADESMLNGHIKEGHLSSSLCHIGGISHLVGEQSPSREIASAISSNELLSNSFDRMASHLRANEVDIDGDAGALTRGPWLVINPVTEEIMNHSEANRLRQRESQRSPHAVPNIEAVT
ncbi:MAG: Gfo/Idh/MocA family oxidoreductase [Planctomycetota bacterium]